jgi:probable selenium-dependent hydroxylase accessory protein YqeC
VRIDLNTSITDAVAVSAGDLVSIVGAGGKTSLMYGLGHELAAAGNPVLMTTTTRIWRPDRRQAPRVVLGPETEATSGRIAGAIEASGPVLAALEESRSEGTAAKLKGFSPEYVEELYNGCSQWTIVAECDGAMGKSLKVPRDHEPPMAPSTSVFVVLVGVDCLGRSIGDDSIFRPPDICRVTGCSPDATVDEDLVAEAVLSRKSYLGRKPPGARMCVLLNKVDPRIIDGQRSMAGGGVALNLALKLKQSAAVERVCLGSLKDPGRRFLVVR